MAPSAPSESRKAPKDLACADCQRRKKRCDKQSPCSNCLKHNVPCVPSSPAPPRKRRQPMKELLERLAACEERLKHCNCHQTQQFAAYSPSSPPPAGQQQQQQLEHFHSHHHHHHDQQHPHAAVGAPPSPPASAASRDAAIANVLDHGSEEEDVMIKDKFAPMSRVSAYTPATMTTTTTMSDTREARA